MKQLVHIHGGEWFDSYNDYLKYLIGKQIDDPQGIPLIKWRDRYEEFLGEDWLVIRPRMPSPGNAKYKEWKIWFEKYLPYIKDGVVLVGHSLGATFLAQYLSEENFPKQITSLHLVALAFEGVGGFGLNDGVANIVEKVKKIYVYHSIDDPLVPYESSVRLHSLIPGSEFIKFEDRGHILTYEFPELFERIKVAQ